MNSIIPKRFQITLVVYPALLIGAAFSIPTAISDESEEKLAVITSEVAQAVQSGTDVKDVLDRLAVNEIREAVDTSVKKIEEKVLTESDFVYLDLSIAMDSFTLTGSDTELMVEGVGVYRLAETPTLFAFNQSSIVRFDDRTTFNTGFGVRKLHKESLILGSNLFYDYETTSGHSRWGLGLELLSDNAEFRTNLYRAITGVRTVDGVNETALDGYDVRFSYMFPFKYQPRLFVTKSKFKDDGSYETKLTDWGLRFPFADHWNLSISRQKQDSKSAQTVGSLTYSIPFGKRSSDIGPTAVSNRLSEKMYMPVERENRIIKKKLNLGVTVSGF